jgi:transcriptional regulator with XRE-family HTH domain
MQARLNTWMREDPALNTLGQRLRYARMLRKLTQTSLAERARVNQSDISKIERGDSLSTVNGVALARALGVNPLWLDNGEGPMSPAGSLQPTVPPDENSDPVQPSPALGTTILQLGALLAALSPMGRKLVVALVEDVLKNPASAREAAETADAIARTQRLPVRDESIASSFGRAQENPVETGIAPLELPK